MKEIPAMLNQNIQIMKKYQPKLVSRLLHYIEDISSLKEPFFQETTSGRWVSGLTSTPFFEKNAILEKSHKKKQPAAVYLLFGVGAPPYLFHILRSLPREALSVIVIEPSFDLLLHTLSLTSVFQALPVGCRLSFITDKDWVLIDEAFACNVVPIGIYPVSNAISVVHVGESEAIDFKETESAFKKQIIYRLTMLGNSPEDTLLGMRHAALNTPRILQSFRMADLKSLYGERPFVLVAAGPSLEKNVHLLEEIQDHCVIVACDTILFNLLERGILPHIVTSIERPYITYTSWVPRVIEKYHQQCEKILLLSQSVSYPLVAGRWPGPSIVVGKMDVPVDSWFTGAVLGEQLLSSGLSVSHMALALAFFCNAPSVALIGQDLAYGEDGASHAADTVPDSVLRIEQNLRKEMITVPGVNGGKVETSRIWLTFIQIFERLIAVYQKTPVYDCTEGGAIIEGTEICKFSSYIEEKISGKDVLVSRLSKEDSKRQIQYAYVLDSFEKAFSQLDRLDASLQDMRSGISKCVAPALPPVKRQGLALSVAQILDEIHAVNPVLSFIGQSYTHLSGAVLAENRFLETVEQVTRWKKIHDEILESHTYAVAFLRQWLLYAKKMTALMSRLDLPDFRSLLTNGEEEFLSLFNTFQAGDVGDTSEESAFHLLQLADLLSCKDPIREKWAPDALWKASLVLFAQGRADEARRFMAKAYKIMEDKELPAETIGLFFKDWGKMASADDLCVFSLPEEASTYLANAKKYLPEDEEIHAIQENIVKKQRKFILDSQKAGIGTDEEIRLLLLRSEAEAALLREDLPAALQTVEDLVWGSLDTYPGMALPHLRWLMKTTCNCMEASDREIAKLSAEILDRIISSLPKLMDKPLSYPVEFLSYMTSKGIKFDLGLADKKTSD